MAESGLILLWENAISAQKVSLKPAALLHTVNSGWAYALCSLGSAFFLGSVGWWVLH